MKLGFVINPLAGIGGSVGLKGSDGRDIVELALSRGAVPQAGARAMLAMRQITDADNCEILTANDSMGEQVLKALGLACEVVYNSDAETSASDTRRAVKQFISHNVDLIVFAGGDGTARDVLDSLKNDSNSVPVVGIPAGVKIHSAVYAVNPERAGELIRLILQGEAMNLREAQVMDLDEKAFRDGRVDARCYGYLYVPADDVRMQSVKQGGINYHDLAVEEIAAELIENMQPDIYYLIASGSTTAEIMQQLALPNTLLGVDIICNRQLVASDVDEKTILQIIEGHPVKLVVSVIGGQGHVFGRGNQQLSARVIRLVTEQQNFRRESGQDIIGRDNIIIIATSEKLRSLNKRPMLADTGDPDLDRQLSGLYPVVTGYQQKTLYRLN